MVENALVQASTQMESNAGVIPAIYVEAPASGESDFSWRLFYQRILSQLGDNLDAPKVAYGVDPQSGRLVRPEAPAAIASRRYGLLLSVDCVSAKFDSLSSTRRRTSFVRRVAIAGWRFNWTR